MTLTQEEILHELRQLCSHIPVPHITPALLHLLLSEVPWSCAPGCWAFLLQYYVRQDYEEDAPWGTHEVT